jgi:hypothetical protein
MKVQVTEVGILYFSYNVEPTAESAWRWTEVS